MEQGLDVRIGVLGPVEVTENGQEVALSPQLRRLLGLLAVAEGQPVSADRLATYLADGRVEGSTVRTAVSRLRKVVGDRVESVEGGYRLVASEELDLRLFATFREQARSAQARSRVKILRAALALWRGAAFGDLREEEWAVVAANAAEQARVACAEDLGEALMDSGEFGEAVEVLEPVVIEQPYREQPVKLLMRALHGDGRTADGLRAFERFRICLRDEVGLDPSPELRAIETELLAPQSGPQPAGSTSSLPDGTVTFLFTDIVGSTQRWQADESAMARELADHDVVLRDSVAALDGQVFKHTGDGVVAVFTSATSGVAAALRAQRDLGLPVRMGLHTGEAELRDGDYYGPTLNRAARIMDAGHGGQVLLSTATAALVHDLDLTDLGEHRLKGLESLERVWQVGTEEFSPLRAETARKGNLPSDPSPFIGRRTELDELATLVVDHRVVTLLGVGGTGKTRLALETARSVAPAYPDGCWLIELAETSSDDLVPLAIASALGLSDAGGDPLGVVTKLFAQQRALVVVDNCEHVLDGAADAIERLIDQCPTVTVLATSREPVMVAGERLAPTPSLSAADAEALFLDRARAEAPELALDDAQRAAVRKVCRRLDGLPLAIELAAARLRTMTPVEIERRLDERFRLLIGGRRSKVERHRTMASALDWSYDLCAPAEQAVFARLSVFATDFARSDAVAVTSDDSGITEFDVEEALAQLVDRSLVRRVVGPEGGSTFRLLETMRAYGHQRLLDSGEADRWRQRHAEHTDRALCTLSFEIFGPDEERSRARIRSLVPEILVAASWCLDAEDWPRVYRLGSACSGAAWATCGEVLMQLSDAAAANDDVTRTLGQLRTAILEDATSIQRDGEIPPLQEWGAMNSYEADWFVIAEHPLIEDHLGYPPVRSFASQEAIDAFHRYLDGFAGHEAQRLYLEWSLLAAHLQGDVGDVGRAIDRIPSIEAGIDRLGSQLLRKRLDAEVALVHEDSGDFQAAADRMANVVAEQPLSLHHTDVVMATRQLRITARAERPVTKELLLRPWEWLDANSHLTSALQPAIFTTATVLEHLGEPELARRLLLHLSLQTRSSIPPTFKTWCSADQLAIIESDEVATEPLAAVKLDLFRFADTL